jgi:hypothetical protein
MKQILNFFLDDVAGDMDRVTVPEKPSHNIFQSDSEADSTEMAEKIWERAIRKFGQGPATKDQETSSKSGEF